MIETSGLVKSFGTHDALKDVNLRVNEGECVVIIGPNGAGKTTLIKILATLTKASRGKVNLGGFDAEGNSVQIRKQIGVISHQAFLYDNLTAYENLKFYAKMYGLQDIEERILQVLEILGLSKQLDRKVRILSRGMQQRLSIARAILHDPPILLMDEPDTGLDQSSTTMLGNMLSELISDNHTILMTTHNLHWCLNMGSRILILHRGRITYQEKAKNLKLPELQEIYDKHTGEVC